MLGNLPVLLVFLQVALGYRRVQLRADRRFLKSGIAAKFSARRGLQQAKTVHKELKRFIRFFHIMLTLKVTAFHIPARVACFGGPQNASVREGDLAVRAAADAEVVAKAPVVEIMLTLEAWLSIGGRLVLLIAGGNDLLLWRRGEIVDGIVRFSPHGWSDFCPLKESALCQLP